MNEQEINEEFRMIISHALLGCDTSDIDKETWDLLILECTKFVLKIIADKNN